MRLVRPRAVNAATLISSNIAEKVGAVYSGPSPYDPNFSYAPGAQATIGLLTMVPGYGFEADYVGRGAYRITALESSPTGDFQTGALSSELMDGDFVIRAQARDFPVKLIGVTVPGLGQMLRAFYLDAGGNISPYSGSFGSSVGTYTLSDYIFLRRQGSVVTILKGASPDVNAATLLYTFPENLSGPVQAMVSFAYAGTSADVQVAHYGTALRQSLFKSTASGFLPDPAVASAQWSEDGAAYAAWSSAQAYLTGDRVADYRYHRVYESIRGAIAPVTMTIASPCVVSRTAHGLAAGTPVIFNSTDVLPTGITAGTVYYVLNPSANSFNIAATPGGAAINTSGTQSGTHSMMSDVNLNRDPTQGANPDYWIDVGTTNKWAMFDSSVGSVTEHPTAIDVTVKPTDRVDTVALLGLENAASIRIVVTDAVAGVVYDRTTSLSSSNGISSWYAYFNEEVVQTATFLATDLPAYSNPSVRVVIAGNGAAPVRCGVCVIGHSKDLGRTLHDNAQVGIVDYSRKEADDFGNYSIVERAFSKRGSFRMRIPKPDVDGVQNVLSAFRATPAVYSASEEYGATLIYGFFREFNIEIDYPLESLVSIEIEGLT